MKLLHFSCHHFIVLLIQLYCGAAQNPPARLFNLFALYKTDIYQSNYYANGVYSATSEQLLSLKKLEDQAVDNVISDHELDRSDRYAVLSWAREEAQAQLWALMLLSFQAVVNRTATADQTNANRWMWDVYRRQKVVSANNAGLEYTRYAGLGMSAFKALVERNATHEEFKTFLTGTPQPYTGSGSEIHPSGSVDGGYCVYIPPAPLESSFTNNIFNQNAPSTCYTPCQDALTGCFLSPPSADQFIAYGTALMQNQIYSGFDPASEFSKIVVAATMGSIASLGSIAVIIGVSYALAPVMANTAFQLAVYPFATYAIRGVSQAFINAVAGATAASGVAAIVGAVIFAVTTAVQVGMAVFGAAEIPLKIAASIQKAHADDFAIFSSLDEIDEQTRSTYLVELINLISGGLFPIVVGAMMPPPKETNCKPYPEIYVNSFTAPETPCLYPVAPWEPSIYDGKWNISLGNGSEPTVTQSLTILTNKTTGVISTKRLHGNWIVSNETVDGTDFKYMGLRLLYINWTGVEHIAIVYAKRNPAHFLVISNPDNLNTFNISTCESSGECSLTSSIKTIDYAGRNVTVSIAPMILGSLPPQLPSWGSCPTGTIICDYKDTTTTLSGPALVPLGAPIKYVAKVHRTDDALFTVNGVVEFVLGETLICSAVLMQQQQANSVFSENIAECEVAITSQGQNNLYATFIGYGNDKPSQNALSIDAFPVIEKLPTSTQLEAGEDIAVIGQPITFSSYVQFPDDLSLTFGSLVLPVKPSGSIQVVARDLQTQGQYILCNVRVRQRSNSEYFASCTSSFSQLGQFAVVTSYSGDWATASSTVYKASLLQITKAATSTSATWSTSTPRPFINYEIILSATVTVNKPGVTVPKGYITFTNSSNATLCQAGVSLFVPSRCPTIFKSLGPVEITAYYSGDEFSTNASFGRTNIELTYFGSPTESPSVKPSIKPSISFAPSLRPSKKFVPPKPSGTQLYGAGTTSVGKLTVYEAVVVSPENPIGGTIVFTVKENGIAKVGCITDSLEILSSTSPFKVNGQCVFQFNKTGEYFMQAYYSGNEKTEASTSNSFPTEVTKALTKTSVSLLTAPPLFVGQKLTFQANLTIVESSILPTGSFTFLNENGGITVCNGILSSTLNGVHQALCEVVFSQDSIIRIVATYNGDINTESSYGMTDVFSVDKMPQPLTSSPSFFPSAIPSNHPSTFPSDQPSIKPSLRPSVHPSQRPSLLPRTQPTTNTPQQVPNVFSFILSLVSAILSLFQRALGMNSI